MNASPPKPKRRAIQICATDASEHAGTLFALCDDGTIWRCHYDDPWKPCRPIPQDGYGKEEQDAST